MALKSLRTSKMRSFLTMLGIIIGVASVIILVSLVNGLSSEITSSLEAAGTNTISVSIMGRGSNKSFSAADMEAFIEENKERFKAYSPVVNAQATVKNGTDSVTASIVGVNELYADMQGLKLAAGRLIQFIDADRLQKVCVVGTYIAEELFDGAVYADSTVKINGSTYTVVGVLEEMADSTEGSDDDIIYVPYTTASRLAGNANVGSYTLAARDVTNIDETVDLIRNELYGAFGNENAYRVVSMSQMIDMMNEITGSIAVVLVGIAGISLIVGGIGIMNIMLVSVTERTREIGIRKALGARRAAIMSQFIIEAATTSAAGGVIGILVGIVLSFVAGSLFDMAVAPSYGAVLIAFGVSVAIGMVFGYFPAGKAARLHPIDALRHE
ncbi:MAG: ABC transporter permease, partial [Clostridiales Family XIII bacterium]|jgi:putative ABC transport system permease protein|nr:ABC transporter permease [Clostridiales Family XIII bacterium]